MMPESWRVAQIVVDRGPGQEGTRGSGYLVARGQVLTAAHVVAGASAVRVRLDVGQPTEVDVQADSWRAGPDWGKGTDLAVVTIPERASAGREVEPVRFGRISDATAVVTVEALGFPRFKLRASPAGHGEPEIFRDLEHTAGHAPVAANRRQGTLAFYLDDPPPAMAVPGDHSPWEGMSGAAVWAAGRIIGVVAEHHVIEGAGRLTVRRVDSAYTRLPASDVGLFTSSLGLPMAASALPDVVPADRGELIRSAYLEQVRGIVPDVLVGRSAELNEWEEFCAGTAPYSWWQADPWAGKSALSSWFVTRPPAGVDVVSFFVTGRLSGQADSDAFLDAMIEQLSALAPASPGSATDAGARVGVWLRLLATAAQHAEERGRRLVVVVDGLDEDNAGSAPLRGRPSVASLLPRKPPRGVRFIITSRPDPGLPDDLPDSHPLRTCAPRVLTPSPVAEDSERRAKQELRSLLAGEPPAVDVVGFIAGSGGGLTAADLSVLTGAAPYQLEPVLRGVFGRSLSARASASSRDAGTSHADCVYLFAHETLRATAEEQLGGELARYRQKIREWAESWRNAGWPDDTPGYAVRGYPGLLVTIGDVAGLSTLARDPRRHEFLLRATGNDYTTLTEMRDAQRLITDQGSPDLRALIELTVYRHALSIRGELIPPELPGVWARLGRSDHAEALARTMTGSDTQDHALSELAWIQAQTGNLDQAEALARTIADPDGQFETLSEVAFEAARHGAPERAESLVHLFTDEIQQVEALQVLVDVMISTGDISGAQNVARSITEPSYQASGLAAVAAELARTGDADQAEEIVRSIVDHAAQDEEDEDLAEAAARAAALLARVVARAGDTNRAISLASLIQNPRARARAMSEVTAEKAQDGDIKTAEALAHTIPNLYTRSHDLREAAITAVRAGEFGRAESLAHAIPYEDVQQQAFGELATTLAAVGEPDRAEAQARMIKNLRALVSTLTELAALASYAGDANRVDRLTETIIGLSTWRDEALRELATTVALVGDADRAEALVRAIADSHARESALGEVAVATERGGDTSRAEALAREIINPNIQEWVFEELSSAIASAGDLHRAEALARVIANHRSHAKLLTKLAGIAVQANDLDSAYRLAANAEALARSTVIKPDAMDEALRVLAVAVAQAGDFDRAEALAQALTSTGAVDEALRVLAIAVAQAGDFDRAETLAHTITDPSMQRRLIHTLATLAVQASNLDTAEGLIRAIDHPSAQDHMTSGLAVAIAQAGDLDRAESLVQAITRPEVRARALGALATAIAQAGEFDRAESLVQAITYPEVRARALGALATAIAQAGEFDHATRLLAEAETPALAVAKTGRTDVFTYLATVAAQIGDREYAARLAAHVEELNSHISNSDRKAQASRELAIVRATVGDLDRAETAAHGIMNTDVRTQALRQLAAIIASAGDIQRAEGIIQAITSPEIQVQALVDLVATAFTQGNPSQADQIIGHAEAIARSDAYPGSRAYVFAQLAVGAAKFDLHRSQRLLAESISTEPPSVQGWPEVMAQFFPASIRDAGAAFLAAYR